MSGMTKRLDTLVALALALAVGACDDTDPVGEAEPDIVTMRITVGTAAPATVNVTVDGCVESGPIMIPINTTVPITVVFLDAAGQPDPIASDPTVFRLTGSDAPHGAEPAPTPATIVWARTGQFAGTLRGSAATTTGSVFFSAFHEEEGHEDAGPCEVPITVTP